MALTAIDENYLTQGIKIKTMNDYNNYIYVRGYVLITDRNRKSDIWHKTKCLRSSKWQGGLQ